VIARAFSFSADTIVEMVMGAPRVTDRVSTLRRDRTIGACRHLSCRVEGHHGVLDGRTLYQPGANLEGHNDAAAIALAGHGRGRQRDRQGRHWQGRLDQAERRCRRPRQGQV